MGFNFKQLKNDLKGDFFDDLLNRKLYATDASVYQELPVAVARPKDEKDLQVLVSFARENRVSLIPRTAGTSLAGQVVGSGIVVDTSKYMTSIIEVNQKEKWVRVQPGVVRDDLNKYLKKYGLFFSPETATANRCMIGGMVGNNSCGMHSLIHGSTRDHLLELKGVLSDASIAHFKTIGKNEFEEKLNQDTLESKLYQNVNDLLSNNSIIKEIKEQYPDPKINRRNTGYALDVLYRDSFFGDSKKDEFNFCHLLAGSEGTLAFTTEVKLNLDPIPPNTVAVIAIHCKTVIESLHANICALKYSPGASELMDNVILECTKSNKNQSENRFFIKGDPGAVLCVEFARETKKEIEDIYESLIKDLEDAQLGYHYPIIWGEQTQRVWNLRKAGMGLLANIPGDAKAVVCIEDAAVSTDELPSFIEGADKIMQKYGKSSIYYAHAGGGELHLRPVLDLKKEKDREIFYQITDEFASLVKSYRGSMSGEHGDGRLRSPFIEKMLGSKIYSELKRVKQTWDPDGIMNPGKIVDPKPMNETLRYKNNQETRVVETFLDFSESAGILRMAEKCNGTGLCRKTHLSGGTMCPSYMATKNEKDSTRARANILRDYLTHSQKSNPFDHEEVKDVLDLCLGCKGCQSDCPSNVDMGAMKAEFLHQYYQSNPVPDKIKKIAFIGEANHFFSKFPFVYNSIVRQPIVSFLIKKWMGFAQERELPTLNAFTLKSWYDDNHLKYKPEIPKSKVYLFLDEFSNYQEVYPGIMTLKLLWGLGYDVIVPEHTFSGRPAISKGLLSQAKAYAEMNVSLLSEKINEKEPLVGIEPSAILSFRDEYPKLLNDSLKDKAVGIKENTYLLEEFLEREIDAGRIKREQFNNHHKSILFHGHCHQKALSKQVISKKVLEFPENHSVRILNTGCCGMSGSFGYEKEHYEVSQQIGELVLFPEVRKKEKNEILCASGLSCRHQVKEACTEDACHLAEIMYKALKIN